MDNSDKPTRCAIVTPQDTAIARAIAAELRSSGWRVAAGLEPSTVIDGLVFEPGLAEGGADKAGSGIAEDLLGTVERCLPRFRPRSEGGARIVVISTRDGLGWPERPRVAAAAGALASAARSLALRLAPDGVTVNVVAALPPPAKAGKEPGPVSGSHLWEPAPLGPHPVLPTDVAETARFFLDARSGYVTGQVLYCCGGASLLSSLSV